MQLMVWCDRKFVGRTKCWWHHHFWLSCVVTALLPLFNKVSVELLGTDSLQSYGATGDLRFRTSLDFTKEEFLAHSQIRINETLNQYSRTYTDDPLGTGALQFTKSTSEKIKKSTNIHKLSNWEGGWSTSTTWCILISPIVRRLQFTLVSPMLLVMVQTSSNTIYWRSPQNLSWGRHWHRSGFSGLWTG